MKVIILEDEQLTAKKLIRLLKELMPDAEIIGVLQSVSESVEWFANNLMPDLIFMDIHLADNLSFSIFDSMEITCPIIFTTAYDEYALKAFEVNSIDYLLKPVSRSSLQRALDKLNRFTAVHKSQEHIELIKKVADTILRGSASYKSSLLVSIRDRLIPIKVNHIAYIYLKDKNAVAVQYDGTKSRIGGLLDDLMKQLDPVMFYRANRQFIVSKAAVIDITTWFGNRVVINLSVSTPERIVVSRTNVQEFKKWLTE
ncbi:LytR/AlgR family response regulator transcription factor [Parabacteroides pacaensis]|uniref:LytR/AlgR family response regulator transcription factor n=1 Tax=Parabacteroides pacaensis TaxID=2086575 RepID=UPI000D104CE0|nr:LytTR family DNA-binding domain-containing protein [Parabacteroides pacaensis]